MGDAIDQTDRRIWVLGLACACPFGDPISGCCMEKLREKSLRERASLVKKMSEEELNMIVTQHKACFAEKERKQYFRGSK